MLWSPPPTRPVEHCVAGEYELIENNTDSHVYVLANRASHNFSVPPDETAFEPVSQPLGVDVPVALLKGTYQVALVEYGDTCVQTITGSVNEPRLLHAPSPDTTAVSLGIRLSARSAIQVGTPSVRLAGLPAEFFEPHPAIDHVPGLGSAAVASLLRAALPRVDVPSAAERVERFLQEEVLSLGNQPDLPYEDGQMWASATTRAHERLLHGFVFLADWAGLTAQDDGRRPAVLSAALELLRAWEERYGGNRSGNTEMAWHDETTAQRVLGVLSLMDACAWQLPDAAAEDLVRNVLEPAAAALFTDDFHETGNNHGMFQDLALLSYAVLAPYPSAAQRSRMAAKALRRLDDYFSASFTAEGVHVENSPSYHLMAAQHLKTYAEILDALGHGRAEHFRSMLARATTYATHAAMPDGVYPPISDTTQRVVGNTVHGHLFDDPHYRFAVTAGRDGSAPAQRTLVLPGTGYAMYRSAWEDPDAAFLFFSAAYNADYHKHSDDLSLFLRYRGVDLLCESGPYGYDYQHPFSQYAYSQFSHNSLVVDGRSLPRTDGKFEAVTLADNGPGDAALDVTGTNARYADVVHVRRVRATEDDEAVRVVVADEIRAEQEHNYELLWNLGPEVKSSVVAEGFRLRAREHQLLRARIESDTPWRIRRVEGVEDPAPRGWRFPAFGEAVPAQQLSVRFRGSRVTLTTTFTLMPPDAAEGH